MASATFLVHTFRALRTTQRHVVVFQEIRPVYRLTDDSGLTRYIMRRNLRLCVAKTFLNFPVIFLLNCVFNILCYTSTLHSVFCCDTFIQLKMFKTIKYQFSTNIWMHCIINWLQNIIHYSGLLRVQSKKYRGILYLYNIKIAIREKLFSKLLMNMYVPIFLNI